MDVERTELPGIGVRFEFETKRGVRLGVVAHRDGRRDFILYDPDDPDSALECINLDADESGAMGELLGGARVIEKLNRLHHEIDNLVSRQLLVEPTSPFADRPLGDTRARTRTGASVVAIIRDSGVETGPSPSTVLHVGDRLVTIGTEEAVAKVSRILRGLE
ncbi:cation:proton antiporter regulatory subunit [Myceligenerans indicum]|uniref:Cation:proton antiporter regulatory subunit n=1 Tax=Myceligenerans indicum TaxID=2593663 RepID=A0ABS1LGJ8_9MICO|nr:cation:proton antiporter regulatory subunit [Myceligenerans indicum]MBL0885278.1 cation:proton antiporter regulatory subunit [Myceligenerans indicum]